MGLAARMALPGPLRNGLRGRPGLGRCRRVGLAATLAAAPTFAPADGIAVFGDGLGASFQAAVAGIVARGKGTARRTLGPFCLSLAAARPLRSCRSTRGLPPGNGRPLAVVGVVHVSAYRAAQSPVELQQALSRFFVAVTLPARTVLDNCFCAPAKSHAFVATTADPSSAVEPIARRSRMTGLDVPQKKSRTLFASSRLLVISPPHRRRPPWSKPAGGE